MQRVTRRICNQHVYMAGSLSRLPAMGIEGKGRTHSPSCSRTPSCLARPCAPTLGKFALAFFSPSTSISSACRFLLAVFFALAAALSSSRCVILALSASRAASCSRSSCTRSFRLCTSCRIDRSHTSPRFPMNLLTVSRMVSCSMRSSRTVGGSPGRATEALLRSISVSMLGSEDISAAVGVLR